MLRESSKPAKKAIRVSISTNHYSSLRRLTSIPLYHYNILPTAQKALRNDPIEMSEKDDAGAREEQSTAFAAEANDLSAQGIAINWTGSRKTYGCSSRRSPAAHELPR